MNDIRLEKRVEVVCDLIVAEVPKHKSRTCPAVIKLAQLLHSMKNENNRSLASQKHNPQWMLTFDFNRHSSRDRLPERILSIFHSHQDIAVIVLIEQQEIPFLHLQLRYQSFWKGDSLVGRHFQRA